MFMDFGRRLIEGLDEEDGLLESYIRESLKSLVKESKTLYHGTTTQHRHSIESLGLFPEVGKFVRDAYGSHSAVDPEECDDYAEEICSQKYDPDEEDYDECLEDAEHECRQEADRFIPSIYLADKESLGSSVSAMIKQVGFMLNKDANDVSDEDIKRYGLLAVIRDAEEMVNYYNPNEEDSWDERPAQAEPGDYYALDNLGVDYVLTGKKLINFLKSHNEWPLKGWSFRKDTKGLKEKLIKLVRRAHPKRDVQEIIEKVNSLSKTEIESYLKYYESI